MREMDAEVRGSGGTGSAEQTAGQNAVSGDADTEFAEYGEDGGFGAPADECVLDLEIGDRVNRLRTPNRFDPTFGEADVSDRTRLYEIGDGADGVFDGGGAGCRRPSSRHSGERSAANFTESTTRSRRPRMARLVSNSLWPTP